MLKNWDKKFELTTRHCPKIDTNKVPVFNIFLIAYFHIPYLIKATHIYYMPFNYNNVPVSILLM